MQIEGYMMVKWRGQFRFTLRVFDGRVSVFERSDHKYDYLWDSTMRGRPTLYEMVADQYDNETTKKTRQMYGDAIIDALGEVINEMCHTKFAKFSQNLVDGTVEFVVVN